MAADTNAGHLGNSGYAVMNNKDNLAPAERADYDPSDYTAQPGAPARANGYPRIA